MFDTSKKLILLTSLLLITTISSSKKIVQISIPKTGTHLLRKCICSLTNNPNVFTRIDNPPIGYYIVTPEYFHKLISQKRHWSNHLFYDQEFEPYLNSDEHAFFFIYRDPRDQIVSFAYYMTRSPDTQWKRAHTIPFDQILMELINDSSRIYLPHQPSNDILDFYQKYLPWLADERVCSIKFEDLVGPKGGGSLKGQYESIKRIAEHLNMHFTDKQIARKASSLFGGTGTFRKGQIGSWKKNFKEEHKQAFKEIAGQLLIDLGYEDSFDW